MKKYDVIDAFQKMFFVAISYIPLGIACGIALQRVGFTPIGILLMSLLAFTGAGQFMTSSMIGAGAPVLSIIILNLFLSLRMSLMTSSLSQYLRGKTKPFLALFGQTTADETYGVNINEFENNMEWTANKGLYANLVAYLTWAIGTWIGGMIGGVVNIPTTVINFLMTAMFISLMVGNLTSNTYIIAGLISGLLAIALKILLQSNFALVFAAIIGSFIGYFLEAQKKEGIVNDR
mgnify:CR=1 FL=1